jgi:hypothetical protein
MRPPRNPEPIEAIKGDGEEAQDQRPGGFLQAQVILGIAGEEGLDGVIAHEPEEDGQQDGEQAPLAPENVLEVAGQAAEGIGERKAPRSRRLGLGRFPNEEHHEQTGGEHHQASHQEGQ